MKQCPVCKESFQDEFSFCDIDGTPLDGSATITSSGGTGKLWPAVGVALVLGTLVIAVGSIIFFPRTLSNPRGAGSSQASGSNNTSPQPVASQSSLPSDNVAANPVPEAEVPATAAKGPADQTALDAAKTAKKNKADADDDDDSADTPLTPKNAAKARSADNAEPVPPDTTRPRTATDSGDPLNPKPAAATASPKRTPADSATATTTTAAHHPAKTDPDDPDDVKSNKNAKKKKGGFLKIFKKIFGQN